MLILYLFLNICDVYDKCLFSYVWLMLIFKLFRKEFSDIWLKMLYLLCSINALWYTLEKCFLFLACHLFAYNACEML